MFWPFLRAMEYAKTSNCRLGNGIGSDVRRAIDDEFACPGNSTQALTGRKIEQAAGGGYYPFIDQDGCCGVIGLDVSEDGVTIRQRKSRPSKFHDSGTPALRRAAARRLAKCASASSSDKSGRVSFNASSTFGPKPGVMCFTARKKFKRQRPLVSSPGEHNTNRIRYREAHAFKHCGSTVPDFRINTCLYESVCGHGYLHIQRECNAIE
jgi:hypothetical protein